MDRRLAVPLVLAALSLGPAAAAPPPPPPPTFIDATEVVGLGDLNATRLCLADLDSDGRPDAVIRVRQPGQPDRYRIFLNRADPAAAHGFSFVELEKPTGLPTPRDGDCLVLADLDNDGHADAIFTRYLDIHNENFAEPEDEPKRTAWLKGNGDGTFGPPQIIEAAQRATTAAIAVGDVNRDGLLDVYLGNWYARYGKSNEAFTNDLLIQEPGGVQQGFWCLELSENDHGFDEDKDAAGRPTYGAVIFTTNADWGPHVLELNYGRRANRFWEHTPQFWQWAEIPTPEQERPQLQKRTDSGVEIGLDGDPIRHGRYPDWLKDLAQRDPRFNRSDEKPYRSHGNTFDAAVGDINNDGHFDLFFAEITHGWAGDSSDRSRFLINQQRKTGELRFTTPPELSVDRIPEIPPPEQWPENWFPRWNQGDLFCELADLDHDTRLDLILSSGDYPDPPPFEQRLRIFHQQPDGTFKDITSVSGIDHAGSQQFSLGDLDGDGDLDIIVGQSFNRFTPEMIAARTPPGPVVRVFLNQTADRRAATAAAAEPAHQSPHPASITLKLVGDPSRGVNRDALGAVVEMLTTVDGKQIRQLRQLTGIGGHAGKQHELIVHFGLGDARLADEIRIHWPTAAGHKTVLRNIAPGRHIVDQKTRPTDD